MTHNTTPPPKDSDSLTESPSFTTLVIATHNAGKLCEFQELLKDVWTGNFTTSGKLALTPPQETGTTFRENAKIKAEAACRATGMWSLADDSGLCVEALGGKPGVWTSDHPGPKHLLTEIKGILDRRAAFMCVLALARPGRETVFFEESDKGTLTLTLRGGNGFHFDPIFAPVNGDGRTYAEMTPKEKATTSHRARAIKQLAAWIAVETGKTA